jgi:Flp pilus assembly protein TadG
MTLWEITRSVEAVWILWLLGLLVLGVGLVRAWRSWRWPGWTALHRDESGASYTLSYAIAFPLYFLLVCVVFESTLILYAKLGTMYAAYAGARSTIVWQLAEPQSLQQERPRQAVFTALAPFASPSPQQAATQGPPPPNAAGQAAEFVTAFQMHARDRTPAAALTRKYLSAAARTRIDVTIDDSRSDGDVRVTVTYRAPLYIPGVGRILAPNHSWPYEYPITSTAVLPNEAPLSARKTLGIDYRSDYPFP